MKAYELNRKTYDKVKKMDHRQMKSFCEAVYTRGFEAGKRQAEGLSDEEIKQALLQVRNIGEKKACEILGVLAIAKAERTRSKIYLEVPEFTGENVPVQVAARVMKKDQQFIRQGIILGILKFGVAFKKEGRTPYDYYISPKKVLGRNRLHI